MTGSRSGSTLWLWIFPLATIGLVALELVALRDPNLRPGLQEGVTVAVQSLSVGNFIALEALGMAEWHRRFSDSPREVEQEERDARTH